MQVLYANEIETKSFLRQCFKMDIWRHEGFVLFMTRKVISHVQNNAAVVVIKGENDKWQSRGVLSTSCAMNATATEGEARRLLKLMLY